MLDHDEIVRLYGPFRERRPEDAVAAFAGYPGLWWVAGGWAIEAFTGVSRHHGDLDPSILRSDVGLLREHFAGKLDIWANENGAIMPVLGPEHDVVPTECENLWLRPSGAEPWEYDVILMEATPETWRFKRDARVGRPTAEILWEHDGITYLRPEIQLLHKARALRPKDQADFDACLPLLAADDRAWLRSALLLAHPDHPWIAEL